MVDFHGFSMPMLVYKEGNLLISRSFGWGITMFELRKRGRYFRIRGSRVFTANGESRVSDNLEDEVMSNNIIQHHHHHHHHQQQHHHHQHQHYQETHQHQAHESVYPATPRHIANFFFRRFADGILDWTSWCQGQGYQLDESIGWDWWLPSLKLPWHLNMDGWNYYFPIGEAYFLGLC